MTEVVVLAWLDFASTQDRDRWVAAYPTRETLDEPGCVSHRVAADPDSATAAIAYGHFADADAGQAHVKTEHMARFQALTRECQPRDKTITRLAARTLRDGEKV